MIHTQPLIYMRTFINAKFRIQTQVSKFHHKNSIVVFLLSHHNYKFINYDVEIEL